MLIQMFISRNLILKCMDYLFHLIFKWAVILLLIIIRVLNVYT